VNFRPQRGGLAEAISEQVTLLSSKAALAKHLGVPVESITLRGPIYDGRCGWDTWTVLVDGQAVGFCNQEVK
jgi:hypothetical protein